MPSTCFADSEQCRALDRQQPKLRIDTSRRGEAAVAPTGGDDAVAELLSGADHAQVSCPRGTDFTLWLNGRPGCADDGNLTARGMFGNLPAGEGYIAPLTGEGTVVAVSLAPLGLSDEPATLSVRDGAPVLICPQPVATARSAIVTSSVSPERCDITHV